MGLAGNGLECDDDMSDAGHRVRGLSIGSEVVVFPEDIWFGRGIYLGVYGGFDDPTHGTSWLWRESHESVTETQVRTNLKSTWSTPFLSSHPSSFEIPPTQTMSEIHGNGLRSKQEIQSLFDTLRSQLDNFQDTREKLVKVNTQLPLDQKA